MGVLWGTRLALVGLVGALLGATVDVAAGLPTLPVVGTAVESAVAAEGVAHATATNWTVGAFVGVVVADVLGAATRAAATVGRAAGVLKGVLGVALGLWGVGVGDSLRTAVVAAWPEVAAVVGSALGWELAGFGVALWVGVVVGDVLGL